MMTPSRFKSKGQGGSLEVRPSPETPPGSMRTRPFRKLVGGHDATVDPLNNEQSMEARNQVASNTPDLMKRQGTTNPVYGGTKQGNKLSNMAATTQDKNAFRPSAGQKTMGRTMYPKSGANMAMKRKLRTAFGQGGLQVKQQSGQTRTTLGAGYQGGPGARRIGGGTTDKPLSVSSTQSRTPKSHGGQRAFNANPGWPKNAGGHKATVSKTSVRPNQGSSRNV